VTALVKPIHQSDQLSCSQRARTEYHDDVENPTKEASADDGNKDGARGFECGLGGVELI
jgi:hypothetical protein